MFRFIGVVAAFVLAFNFSSAMDALTHNGVVGFVSGLVSLVIMLVVFLIIGAWIDGFPKRWRDAKYLFQYEMEQRNRLPAYQGTIEDAFNNIKAGIDAKGRGEQYTPTLPASVQDSKDALQRRIKESTPLPPPE